MKFYKIVSLSTLTMFSIVLFSQTLPAAASNGQQQSSLSTQSNMDKQTLPSTESLSNADIKQIDPYVKVSDNQYVLSSTISKVISSSKYKAAQQSVNLANQQVKQKNLIINTQTKVTIPDNLIVRGYPAKEIRDYWWGRRTIFRSNAAIYKEIHDLETGATLMEIGAVGWVPAAIGAGYTSKLASDLSYNQNIHSKDKIYMDINHALFYTIDVWHD